MALGQVIQSAGALTRSESEFNLLKTENQKRIRVNNSLSNARMTEKDAKAQETDESVKSFIDKYYQKESAVQAEEAARLGMISAAVGVAGGLLSSFAKPNIDVGGIIVQAIGGAFSIAGAVIAYMGAGDEVDMLEMQMGDLSEAAEEDSKNVKALDSNPEI